MEIGVVIIVLLAAFFHALWNATVKSGSDHLLSIAGIQVAGAVIAVFLVPFAGVPHADSWPYLAASIVLHTLYYIGLSQAYRHGDFAQAYPIARGTAPILTTLCGVFFLHETLDSVEIISLCGVLLGIMIFATRRLGVVMKDRAAFTSSLVTSTFIAGYTIVDGVGARLSMNVPGYMVWLTILDMLPILIYTFCLRSPRALLSLRNHWKISFLGAGLSLAAYWMVVWAMTQASIPLVSALRETSIIIAALIGAYYFKEPSGIRRVIASIVIFASIALLASEGV